MDRNGSLDHVWPMLWKPALAGIACGALFGIASTFINWIWRNDYCNTNLSLLIDLPPVAIVLLLALLSALLGVIFTSGYVKKPAEALLPGAVAGVAFVQAAFFFSLALSLITLSPLITYKEPGTYNMFDGFLEDPIGYFTDFYSAGAFYVAVYSLIVMAITAAMAAVYTFLTRRQAGGEKEIKSTNRVTVAIILSIIVIMVIAPPAIAYAGLKMGWIEGSFHDYMNCISAVRNTEDCITINYVGGPNLRFDPGTPFTIGVFDADGQVRDATDSEAIGQSGLSARISPAYGLISNKEANVILSGDGLKKPAHVIVTGHLADGSLQVMLDTVL